MADLNFADFHAVAHIDLSAIPRRKRRFFRNKNLLIKEVSKHIKTMPDVREAEKQRIIEELRVKLEQLAKEELILLAERLFEQMSKEDAEKIVEKNIREKKKESEQLTKADIEEIVNNIYSQIRNAQVIKESEKPQKSEKEKEIMKVKERLEAIRKGKTEDKKQKFEKEGMLTKLQTQAEKFDKEILAEIEKDDLSELGLDEEEFELGGKEKDESLFRELEQLTEEDKKKRRR
ncbi:MAG: hypothetical protein QXM75_03115 [Candidatus Diapherotrites archaeon]